MAKTSKNLLEEARKEIKQVSIDEARNLMEQGAVVIDVRESDEWRQGHLGNAVSIPKGFLELRIEEKVPDRKAPVILHCASGMRSNMAGLTLSRELGYENIYNMVGGFNAWKDAGLPWVADRKFTEDEIARYSRHFLIPEVGEKGQAKLLDAKVLLIGAGALGSPSGLYLAAAGVGTIGFVDFDTVDLSNLQRQIIHTTDRVGMPKTESAQKSINAINPGVKVVRHDVHLSSENVMDIIKDYDVVINCSDNFPTRYLINDACVFAKKPLVDGAIFQFEGNATVFSPDRGGPCYRCLYPEPPPPGEAPSCAEAGVLGVLPGLIGSVEALEAIKLILGTGKPLIGSQVYFNTLSDRDFVHILKIRRNPKCVVCGEHPTVTQLIDYENFCNLAGSTNGTAAGDSSAHQEELRAK